MDLCCLVNLHHSCVVNAQELVQASYFGLFLAFAFSFFFQDVVVYGAIFGCLMALKYSHNLLTKIKSLLAVFCFEITGHSKQTGVKSGLCFSINGFMLLGKPPSLVRSKCAGTCSGQLFWPVSCFCLQLLFSGCSCIRCNLWVPDGS